jgi:rubrerythrin
MTVTGFAQEIDRSGRCFYEEMAMRAQHPGVARIFRTLAAEEAELLRRHQTLPMETDGCEGETLDRRMNVFEEMRQREDQLHVDSDIAAYRLAMEAEQELLREYRRAARNEKHPAAKAVLTRIIKDEVMHLREIESLYDFVNAPNHYLAWGEFSNLGEYRNFGRDLV